MQTCNGCLCDDLLGFSPAFKNASSTRGREAQAARSRMKREFHVRFWRRGVRSDPLTDFNLFTSWSWRRFQGFGCSPIKVERELGLERCKTVWSLSAFVVWRLRRLAFSTRGPKQNNPLFVSCSPKASWLVTLFWYNHWKHQCEKMTLKQIFKN